MSKRDRPRRPARRTPFLTPKPVILVVTEGKVTEPGYLNGFRDWVHNPRVLIRMVPGAGSPGSIVKEAVTRKRSAEQLARRERDRNHAFDEVWCVFDVDEDKDMDGAEVLAKQNGLSLAISNPCFELWLLLHFREQPGMQSCSEPPSDVRGTYPWIRQES